MDYINLHAVQALLSRQLEAARVRQADNGNIRERIRAEGQMDLLKGLMAAVDDFDIVSEINEPCVDVIVNGVSYYPLAAAIS